MFRWSNCRLTIEIPCDGTTLGRNLYSLDPTWLYAAHYQGNALTRRQTKSMGFGYVEYSHKSNKTRWKIPERSDHSGCLMKWELRGLSHLKLMAPRIEKTSKHWSYKSARWPSESSYEALGREILWYGLTM